MTGFGPNAQSGVPGVLTLTGNLTLPQINAQATPALNFGDGDTGLYESGDDVLRISIGGTLRWSFTGDILEGIPAGASFLANETASATNPTLGPRRDDTTSGIGGATGEVSIITGGTEAINVSSSQLVTLSSKLVLEITDSDGTVEGSIWYDASEDKLKFKTAAGVETITSS